MARGQSLYDWCIENGEWGQQLLFEFGDGNNSQQFFDEETGMFKCPLDYSRGSHTKIKWTCNKGHTWYATVNSRTDKKRIRCPHCFSSHIVREDNNLYNWCLNNGEWGQQLLQEFVGLDEHGNKIEPTEITYGSNKKILWKCNKGHTWYAAVSDRTGKIKRRCPHCFSCSIVREDNNLYQWCLNNGEWGQQLLQEFQGLDEYGNKIKPTDVARASEKKVLWKCNKGHAWYATVVHRTLNKRGCPHCFSKRITREDNNLYNWCLNNGEWGQQLLQEFQGIDEKGNKITPTEITYGSKIKVLWKCNKGHTWYATVLNRTLNRNGCPHCSPSGTSYPEQFLYKALLQIYPKAISRGKYQGIEYDIAIPEEKICIEYSGITWHVDKFSRDEMKANICKEHNVRFIQIYAHNGEIDTEDIFDKNQIIYRIEYDKHNQQLVHILDHILKSLGHSISEIDIKKAQTDAYNFKNSLIRRRL